MAVPVDPDSTQHLTPKRVRVVRNIEETGSPQHSSTPIKRELYRYG